MRQLHELADQHALAARSQAARDFSAAAYYVMKSGEGGVGGAAEIASTRHPRVAGFLQRAAVSGASTSSPGWAAEIADAGAAQAAFLGLLSAQGSVFDTMLGSMLRLPTAISNVRVQTTAIQGNTTGEGMAKPIYALSFMGALTERFKSTAMVVLSNSLLDAAPDQAISVIERELGRGVIAALDRSFLALLVNGIAPISTSGTAATDVLSDIGDALANMDLHAASRVFMIVHPITASSLAFMPDGAAAGSRAFPSLTVRGGDLGGITVVVTDQLPGGSPGVAAVLVDASRIAAWSEGIGLSRATHASLEMSDSPIMFVGGIGSPDAPVSTQQVSLWQTNCSAIRGERWWSASRLVDTAVVVIEGAWA